MRPTSSFAVCSGRWKIALLLMLALALQPTYGHSAPTTIRLRSQKSYAMKTRYFRPFPSSVTISPNGRWIAVTAIGGIRLRDYASRWLEIVDISTGRLVRDFGNCDGTAVRWHPSEPLLVNGDGFADRPKWQMLNVATGAKRVLFRGEISPICWARAAILADWGFTILHPGTHRVVRSGNLGLERVWDYPHTSLMRMSCGPHDAVAAELLPYSTAGRAPAQRLEIYAKVPRRMQWVKVGRIDPKLQGRKVIWYPNNPNILADGRLVYLRIYPAQWTHSPGGPGEAARRAATARNRAEVWVSSPDGRKQRKAFTLWDLRPQEEDPSADWFTIDRAGRTICYLSWDKIRVLRLKKPL